MDDDTTTLARARKEVKAGFKKKSDVNHAKTYFICSTNKKELQPTRAQNNFTSIEMFQQHHCHEQKKTCKFDTAYLW